MKSFGALFYTSLKMLVDGGGTKTNLAVAPRFDGSKGTREVVVHNASNHDLMSRRLMYLDWISIKQKR